MEWQGGEDQGEYLGTGSPDPEPQESPHFKKLFSQVLKYPGHFDEKMREVYNEIMKQANMIAAYYGLSKEQMTDIIRLAQNDFARDIARE